MKHKMLSGALAVLMALCALAGTGLAEEEVPEREAPVVAWDFTLPDQYGETHTLSLYQGKTVFLNFWATWCPWCVQEMPDIEALYHELGENGEDVVILGVASPSVVDTADEAAVKAFIREHSWTYPILMDATGELFDTYGVTALPTTWLIRPDGCIMGYAPGALEKDTMLDLIRQTQATAGE